MPRPAPLALPYRVQWLGRPSSGPAGHLPPGIVAQFLSFTPRRRRTIASAARAQSTNPGCGTETEGNASSESNMPARRACSQTSGAAAAGRTGNGPSRLRERRRARSSAGVSLVRASEAITIGRGPKERSVSDRGTIPSQLVPIVGQAVHHRLRPVDRELRVRVTVRIITPKLSVVPIPVIVLLTVVRERPPIVRSILPL